MKPFIELEGIAAPLSFSNVDTDKIIPARFLKTVSRHGLGNALFDTLRRHPEGHPRAEFVLNHAPYDKCCILVALDNFGCGSSREHAPWALLDFGITCVIAASFADIFYNNCVLNGVLPVTLPREHIDALITKISDPHQAYLKINLNNQTVRSGSKTFHFDIDPGPKRRLIAGLDEITLTLEHEKLISAFEAESCSHVYRPSIPSF